MNGNRKLEILKSYKSFTSNTTKSNQSLTITPKKNLTVINTRPTISDINMNRVSNKGLFTQTPAPVINHQKKRKEFDVDILLGEMIESKTKYSKV